ncbi:MAG: DUF1565 domain-containing protein, partial [Chloroflexota bacterium]|nr:DUF1565 domain-containing protein [Chloroflexota bacterium]
MKKHFGEILVLTLLATLSGGIGNVAPSVRAQGEEPICEAPAGYNCWYVSPSGDDANEGSLEDPFGTIQHAVDVMNGGDFVYLRGGTYQENVQIPLTQDGTCVDVECAGGSWSTIKSYPG